MRDIADQLRSWFTQGTAFALATVTQTWQSSPRPAGAAMAVSTSGEVVGSISGGCVEGAVYELAQQVLITGKPESAVYGVADDDALSVGLTCGGTIEVFVEVIDRETFPEFLQVAEAIEERQALSVATVISGTPELGRHLVIGKDSASGSLGSVNLDLAAVIQGRGFLEAGRTGLVHLGKNGEQRVDDVAVFIASFAPPPQMFVFGAIDFAAAVVRIGKFLGYHVTLCDARPVFATSRRFPEADEIVVQWPHKFLSTAAVNPRTVICVLTHDPKFDVPLLEAALQTNAAYIGAMGSRRTHEDRMARLKAAGVDERTLGRLSSPIGLDLGARTPEETAVSIAAEIIASAWGGSGQKLSTMSTPIHGARSRYQARQKDRSESLVFDGINVSQT
ncbi:XdhC family protein [Arthrobacter crystallopoietes]|uniref:XdhC family protein n=1 Tax=Crystallibacter crystallopoietes TaxID=37928 RepID=UPI001110FF9D|nr:XdhC family protein [Arthrobacter crystallopoietes]